MIYIASDHAGFRLKEEIKSYLDELEIEYQDLGPEKFDPDDDMMIILILLLRLRKK